MRERETTDHRETRAGAFSGVAAGILIIALTAMALIAFQPSPGAPMRASSFEASAVGAASGP